MGIPQNHQHPDAPCKTACPAGIDVPRCHRLIGEGRWDEALAVLTERVPFPAVLGRVCPAPCESECQVGATWKEPLAIRTLHTLVAGKAGSPAASPAAPPTGKRVAVVGSGPAGLAAARYLAKLGHKVVVFEALPRPGGMMRVGIPDFRLARDALDREIRLVEESGVEIRTGVRVDSVEKLLKEGYDAVVAAIGAHKGAGMQVEGEDIPGVMQAVSFLRAVNLGERVKVGEKVVVVGGGNSAVDAARVSLRQGAKEVTILYRRSREEMPAGRVEIEEAMREGVRIEFLSAPAAIRRLNGKIQLDCVRMRLGEPDASGRRRPEPVPGSSFSLDADAVIAATGQSPDIPRGFGLPTRHGVLDADPETLVTPRPGVFAAGDAIGGVARVAKAIGDGRKAAMSVDRYLGGRGDVAGVTALPAEEVAMKTLPPTPLSLSGRAAAPVLSAGAGIEEARRCYWCDLRPRVLDSYRCATCVSCQLRCSFVHTGAFNPEKSGITIEEVRPGVKELTFNDNCVGCSVCARYCTYSALALEKKAGESG